MDMINNVIKAANGDQNAISEFYYATYPKARAIAVSILKNEADAEDIVQDSYIKAFANLNGLDDAKKFESWLGRIVTNGCKDYLKKKKPALFSDQTAKENDEPFEWSIEDESKNYRPEDVLVSADTRNQIMELLNSLPDEQRICLICYVVEEMKVCEIADMFGISESTVKSRINYAKSKMQTKINELEAQGVKLRGMVLFPFIRFLFANRPVTAIPPLFIGAAPTAVAVAEANAASTASVSATTVVGKAVSDAVAKTAVKAAGKTAAKGLGLKIASAFVAGAVAVSATVTGIVHLINKDKNENVEKDDAYYEQAYSEVLKEYKNCVEKIFIEGNKDVINDWTYIYDAIGENSTLQSDDFGYAFYDLNNNGSKELILLIKDSSKAFRIYSLQNKKPSNIINAGTFRISLSIKADKTIVYDFHGGYENYGTKGYTLNSDDATLELIEEYGIRSYDENSNHIVEYFRGFGDKKTTYYNVDEYGSDFDFNFESDIPDQNLKLDFIPILDYNQTVDETDYEQAYSEVLKEYRYCVEEIIVKENRDIDCPWAVILDLASWDSGVTGKDFGYAFYDINGNGSKELILQTKESSASIIAVYTLQNKKPYSLYILHTIREKLSIKSDGTIVQSGSNGAEYNSVEAFLLEADDVNLTLIEEYGMRSRYFSDNLIVEYYRGFGGERTYYPDTADFNLDFESDIPDQNLKLDFIPILDYNHTVDETDYEQAYSEVLKEYKYWVEEIFVNGANGTECPWGRFCDGSMDGGDYLLDNFGYAFYDINGNGSKELILQVKGDNPDFPDVEGIYSLHDGKPKCVYNVASFRDSLSVKSDGTIITAGNESLTKTYLYSERAYSLDKDDAKLILIEEFGCDESKITDKYYRRFAEQNAVYNSDSNFVMDFESDISKEKLKLDFIPISSYGAESTNNNWSAAYKDFILNGKYLTSGQEYSDEIEHWVALYDMDSDKTPELVITNGGDGRVVRWAYIYTYTDNQVKYLDIGPTDAYYLNNEEFSGIIGSFRDMGEDNWTYYSKSGNTINTERICTEFYSVENQHTEKVTDNDALFEAWQKGKFQIDGASVSSIRDMGWNNFAEHRFG